MHITYMFREAKRWIEKHFPFWWVGAPAVSGLRFAVRMPHHVVSRLLGGRGWTGTAASASWWVPTWVVVMLVWMGCC